MARSPSFGATIGYDVAGGSSYVTVGKVKDISGPSLSRGTIDITDHDSTSGFREFFGGLVDGGELTFAVGYDHTAAAHYNIYTDFVNDTCTPWAWLVTCNTCAGTYTWAFDGILTGLTPTEPVEGQNVWELTIKVTGVPNLTSSA